MQIDSVLKHSAIRLICFRQQAFTSGVSWEGSSVRRPLICQTLSYRWPVTQIAIAFVTSLTSDRPTDRPRFFISASFCFVFWPSVTSSACEETGVSRVKSLLGLTEIYDNEFRVV